MLLRNFLATLTAAAGILFINASVSHADIFRWDNGELIPGTEGIEPGPGVQTRLLKLEYAGLSRNDLTAANFFGARLLNADFTSANLENASFNSARLTNVKFTDAVVAGVDFQATTRRGLTEQQLHSTASFQLGDLRGIGMQYNDLSGWSLRNQDLSTARFNRSNLTNTDLSSASLADADLTDTIVTGADFTDTILSRAKIQNTVGFTKEQLYSSQSYASKDLRGIMLTENNLTGWDFSGQDLSGSSLAGSFLDEGNLSGADFTNAAMHETSLIGTDLSAAALRNTNLQGAQLTGAKFTTQTFLWDPPFGFETFSSDLSNADLSGANLTSSFLKEAVLTNADLGGANLRNANLSGATNLSEAILDSATVYNQWTAFPDGFDPVAWDLTRVLSDKGDIDADGVLDVGDIDMLAQRFRWHYDWLADGMFDLNGDSTIDAEDLAFWVHDLKHTWLGDADLNGDFNSADLVTVLAAGEYEDDITGNSGWATGDWNADGEFNSSDLIVALADGGYEQGQRPVVAVPEPLGCLTWGAALIVIAMRCRSKQRLQSLIAAFILLTSIQTQAQELTEIVVFSDSMSDVGNIFSLKGNPPSPPYLEGRFSNGPVWVENLADYLLIQRPTPSTFGGTNYAHGGGSAGSTRLGVDNKDIDTQIAEYLQKNIPQPDQIFALWGGGNDFNFYLFNPGQPDPSFVAELMAGHVERLASAGARNFLVLNLPRRFGTVNYNNDAIVFNQVLADSLETIRSANPDVNIAELDYFSLFEAVSDDPDVFGFTEFRTSACRDCGFGGRQSPKNISETPDNHYFWDDAHLSAAAHQLVGDAAYNLLATSDGDFDRDGQLAASDIDQLTSVIRSNDNNVVFELDGNWIVNQDDRDFWIKELQNSWYGDADLNGEFNSIDLVTVLAAGQYEDDVIGNSGWGTGDWNADLEFTTGDLVVALADGGYERGLRPAAVPEPAGVLLVAIGSLSLCLCRRVVSPTRSRRSYFQNG